ncbi:hypothetical protein BV898_16116 [Hypsibius exemplaris]|uniref:DUF3105 domain-containing protein n=1 Tax=Hypsibius exemplaris TaxID=2072580 RepID=A0A9X6NCY0_HYPEX|nr:hypothetical protein BV898_16116 [Hypsibius exemplaris]
MSSSFKRPTLACSAAVIVAYSLLCFHRVAVQAQQQFIIAEIPPIPTAADEGITADMMMSGRTPDCDDGTKNLTVDWNGWDGDRWCFGERWTTSSQKLPPTEWCGPQPPPAIHHCMSDTISYEDVPPTSGNHRPSWAIYGEYTYLPPQRWLHNLEHGAVALLYNPCADPVEIDKLRKLVTGCLRRHVITPYNKLPRATPFALVTWGCKLMMASADIERATMFIQTHAKHGAEQLSKEGQYNLNLLQRAAIVSDYDDSILCPNSQRQFFSPNSFKRFFM